MNKHIKSLGLMLVVVFLCICSFGILFSSSPDGANVSPEIDVPVSTPTTCSPTPFMEEIVSITKDMTDAQRNHYNDSLVGTCITEWEGIVSDVDEGELLGGYSVYVDIPNVDQIGSDVHLNVSEDVALSINKGETIKFSGIVYGVSDIFLDETLFVKNPKILK